MNCGDRELSLSKTQPGPDICIYSFKTDVQQIKEQGKQSSVFFQLTLICFVLWARICVTQFHFPGRCNPPETPPGLPSWQEDLVPPRKARTGNQGNVDLKPVVESHQLS